MFDNICLTGHHYGTWLGDLGLFFPICEKAKCHEFFIKKECSALKFSVENGVYYTWTLARQKSWMACKLMFLTLVS